MQQIQKILFVADRTTETNTNALERAADLARSSGASLTLIDVVEAVGTNDPSLANLIKQMQERLVEERAESLGKLSKIWDGVAAKVTVVPGKDIDAITHLVSEEGFDIVIKSTIASHLGHMIWGALDQKLMRKCPCAVWLVREDQDHNFKRVVAAVDSLGDEELARNILETAATVVRLIGGELHAITVVPTYLQLDPHHLLSTNVNELMRDDCKRRFDGLCKDLDVPLHTQILEGEPAERILEYVSEADIELVVAGSVARTGIPGLLMGNTAEMIFGALKTSVLTIKPNLAEAGAAVAKRG